MEDTMLTRQRIGMSNLYDKWRDASPEYTSEGLRILGHPVMEPWEDNYMEHLARAVTHNAKAVLEVGYGLGLSANYIQRYLSNGIHVVIEANKHVFSKIVDLKVRNNNKVLPFLGFWEECVPYLRGNTFDGILFDTYPLRVEDIHKNHFPFFKEAYRLLKSHGRFTYYSDESDNFSKEHRKLIDATGFKIVEAQVVKITRPDNCEYWNKDTFLLPVLQKVGSN